MQSSRVFIVGLLTAAVGAAAAGHFKPPRTAVVDTFEIIDNYKKKELLETRLRAEVEEATREIEIVQTELRQVVAELKILEEGTDDHDRQVLREAGLKLKFKNLNVKNRRKLEASHREAIGSIRKEVKEHIEHFARSNDLDLVVEKKIPFEGRGNAKINIPIIRFVKPEIEITGEITRILNDRFKRLSKKP